MKDILPYHLIVTSGPTREWIDPVRFISNPASGRTGWYIASTGKDRFEELTYISGPVAPDYSEVNGVRNVSVESTQEMHDAVHECIGDRSILIMTAAPADYYPKNSLDHKIKKQVLRELTLELLPTVDILKSLIPIASRYTDFYRIGFAAETQNIAEQAAKKLKEKELFMICANQVYKDKAGFGDNNNTLYVMKKNGQYHTLGSASKAELAVFLLDMIALELPLKSDLKLKALH